MPPYEYNPPARGNIRERALNKVAKRLAVVDEQLASFELDRPRGLSPLEQRLNAQYKELLETAAPRLRDALEGVKRSNAAEREAEQRLKKLTPLQRNALRGGLYRSSKDRNAAVLGMLERERRRNAPLTRDALARAKAIAASRRYFSDQGGSHGSRGYSYSPTRADLADPCIDYHARQIVRREVMFAMRKMKGYRVPHRRSPC